MASYTVIPPPPVTPPALEHARSLPRLVPIGVAAGSAAVASAALIALGAFSVAGGAALTVVIYLVFITVTSRAVEGARKSVDRFITTLVFTAFGLAMLPLIWVSWTVLEHGLDRFNLYFLTHSMRGVFGGMDAGGIYHAVVGTLLVTAFATLISVPIGLMTAIYLIEYGRGKLDRSIRFFVDVMTGIPSIVAGLFAYALFAIFFGPGVRMGAAGSVALSVLMIPIVVRSAEEMLRLVPNELREASYALGVPKWRTIVKVVIPTAIGGITAGITLAISRIIGETAPLLIVMGVINSIEFNIFADQRMMTLPVFIFGQYRQGLAPCGSSVADCIPTINYDRAWAASLTLILIVMLLNLVARLIARYFAPKTAAR